MYLIRLIYASKTPVTLNHEDIEQITDASRDNNEASHITGVLCYSNNYFLQCIEGSRAKVNALYRKILKDKRHSEPAILQYEEISERDFMDWSMGYIPPSSISGEMVLRFSGEREFNPFSMNGECCHRLLKELWKHELTR